MSKLSYQTFVSDGVQRARGALPSGAPIVSSPITSTLITGAEDALLVDTADDDRADRPRGRLARGDRQAASLYTRRTRTATTPDFPGLIGETPLIAQPVPTAGLALEGESLVPIDVGHTDSDDTTVLHVPSLELVVAGDAVYNGVHQYLFEAGPGGVGIDPWLAALDRVAALRSRFVIAGHKNKALPDDPKAIDETRRYLLDVKRLIATRPTRLAYFEQMVALYPERLNHGPLWSGAAGLLPA